MKILLNTIIHPGSELAHDPDQTGDLTQHAYYLAHARSRADLPMTPPAVPPLTRCYPDGTPYTRMDEVERILAVLTPLPFDDILERCAITSRRDPGYLPPECLVHLMRSTRLDNRDMRFNKLFELLQQRLARVLPRSERRQSEDHVVVDAAVSDINDVTLDRFRLLVTLDRQGDNKLDFYEVHFDEAVALLRLSARKRIARRAARETELAIDENGELSPAIERAAESLAVADDTIFSDPIVRPRLLAAIDTLPTEQKEVITMMMRNIPSESKDPAIPTISAILGCDPRTVRYRRDRAVEKLQAALGLGNES